MAQTLIDQIAELNNYVHQLQNLGCVKALKGVDESKMKNILNLVTSQISLISQEASTLDTAIEARDANIRALGEKLSDLRLERAEPFFVKIKKPQELYRSGESEEWTRKRRETHTKELYREMARLSLAPMGLTGTDLEKQVYELSATMQYEQKALDLIRKSKSKGVDENKIRDFLIKKDLPGTLIDCCLEKVRTEQENGDVEDNEKRCITSSGTSEMSEYENEKRFITSPVPSEVSEYEMMPQTIIDGKTTSPNAA